MTALQVDQGELDDVGAGPRPSAVALPSFLAALVAAVVVLFGWHGSDLPNQVYRVTLFHRYGLLTFDTFWYGGHYFFTYSVLTPILAGTVGLRVLGAASAVAATVAYAHLARRHLGAGARLSSVVFALGTAVPLLIGEITFLPGLAFGLIAVLALDHRRRVAATVLALACTLASPLAGLFLLMAIGAWAYALSGPAEVARPATLGRLLARLRASIRQSPEGPGLAGHAAVMAAAAAPLAISVLAFHESGSYHFPVQQLVTVFACTALGWCVVPKRMRALRAGLVIYSLTAVALFVVPNPVGGNLVRLGAYLAPALVAALCWNRKRALALLLVPALIWQWSTGVSALTGARGDATRSASYFQPLLDRLAHVAPDERLEIPFTAQHWEAAYVAPHVPLARGWERQTDQANNPLFYGGHHLTAAEYRSWLDDNGVSLVALPDATLDPAGEAEAALIRQGLPYLHRIWHAGHWTLWRVERSPGLVSGAARLSAVTPDRFTLTATRATTVTVRFHYTRTWAVTAGQACIEPTADGWTRVHLLEPGSVTVTARPFHAGADCPASVEPR